MVQEILTRVLGTKRTDKSSWNKKDSCLIHAIHVLQTVKGMMGPNIGSYSM